MITEHDGGWFGASGNDTKPKRLFRTREEAEAADQLYLIVADPPGKKPAGTSDFKAPPQK